MAGISVSGELDGVYGFGGTGSISVPIYGFKPQSTSLSSGFGVGVGVGLAALGVVSKFQKAYDFNDLPVTHLSVPQYD